MTTNPLFDTLFGPLEGQNRPFLHLPGDRILTADEFAGMIARIAGALAACGVGKGDRVAVQTAKSPQALAIYGACAKIGAVLLPLNPAYTTAEIRYFVTDARPRALVCDPADTAALAPVAGEVGATVVSLDSAGAGSLMELSALTAPVAEAADCAAGDLAAILYTSGTTGRSKGAMLSQANLLSNAQTLKDLWRFTEADRLIHALPIFHTHGLFVAVNICLLARCEMLFLPKFDLDAVLDALPRASSMMGVPTFYTRLLDDARLDAGLARHMRLFVSGSAPLLAETHVRFERRTGHRVLERYGMTETNMNASNPYEGERRAGTVGFALPGVELKITDPDSGTELDRGEIGQIEVRGPNVFMGYWDMPEKTAAELRADGFFITGDLGRFDADGYLHIVGRNKDLIISGGYNIYPKELELVLDAQPGVLESAVIGVPHPDFGETVLGLLVAAPGHGPDIDAIAETCAGQLARFKQPRRLLVVGALPRNAMGKVQKNILRDRFRDMFQGE